MSNNLKLFSVFHKKFHIPNEPYLFPIHAGKAVSDSGLLLPGDDEGDNISSMNPFFCELTVLYNVWKNKKYQPASFWGLCHYRRYFTLDMHWTRVKKKTTYYLNATEDSLRKIFSPELEQFYAATLFEKTIIFPRLTETENLPGARDKLTLKQSYFQFHDRVDWELAEACIRELCPEYLEDFTAIGDKKKWMSCNMMIAHHKVWDAYLSWLFEILFTLNKRIHLSEDPYQQRTIGFLAERLMNVYFHHHKNEYRFINLPVAILIDEP